ncbi:MAG: AMP-binding protein [Actinobacteria bacterium]|nr:AMP-binding protein [Actinomycetota bacterium]
MSSLTVEIEGWLERYGGTSQVAELLCDQHVDSGSDALHYEAGDGTMVRMSFRELGERSSRLAGALREAGVGAGDCVGVMMAKSPELLVSMAALWRLGAVHVPLFTAFGPDAAKYRLDDSGARFLITDAANRSKFAESEESPTQVIVAGGGKTDGSRDIDFDAAVEGGHEVESVARSGSDLLIALYTSGTTGNPKAVGVPIVALASFLSYMRHGLDLRADDVYWNMADPGWAYGLYFGVLGPMLMGKTILWRAGAFDPQEVYAAVTKLGVTNLAGAPTVFRALRAAGIPDDFRGAHQLRVISSAGEPLNAELLEWSKRELGIPIHDHYGQTELGMAVYFSHHPQIRQEPEAGSMGLPAPGYRAVVVDDGGQEVVGRPGNLAIDTESSPQYWFRGYRNDPKATAGRFPHGPRYYLTGDSASLDPSGMLRFASRADDVISTSGYRVGPFEVESALMLHPGVAEVAVIGTPDEMRGEAITAIVVAKPDTQADAALADELQSFVKERLARHLYPRRMAFTDALPKTPSGKVQRNVLRDRWQDADDYLDSSAPR